jgi:CBS domain-containing protein
MQIRKLFKRDVVTIDPNASVLEAARLMRAEHVGDVVVTGPGRRPVGILTDRDIVVSVVAKDVEHLPTLAVKDVLTLDLVVATEDEDAEAVLGRMRRRGVRRVPVVVPRILVDPNAAQCAPDENPDVVVERERARRLANPDVSLATSMRAVGAKKREGLRCEDRNAVPCAEPGIRPHRDRMRAASKVGQ